MNYFFLILKKFKKVYRFFKKIICTSEVKLRCGSYGNNLIVNHRCQVFQNAHFGDNVNFNGIFIKSGGKVTIDDNFHSGFDCIIIPRFHNYDSGKAIP
jgi:acetyltransferase-like isoleucine patch superfamily enzyme